MCNHYFCSVEAFMTWLDRISLFTTLDFVALGIMLIGWLLIGWRIEHPNSKKLSTSQIMAIFRRKWMIQMITREPRIFDAQILSGLRQGTAFFASTSVLALGGVLAVMGNAERLSGVANDLILMDDPTFVWEAKLGIIALFLTNAFLKFAWSNRLFGYAAVLMAAVPNDACDPECIPCANKASEINVLAAQSFNRGLRSIYFALTVTAWIAGSVAMLLATFFTLAVIWRREFGSRSRTILLS